MSSNPR